MAKQCTNHRDRPGQDVTGLIAVIGALFSLCTAHIDRDKLMHATGQGCSIFNDLTVPKSPPHLVVAAMGVAEADFEARALLTRRIVDCDTWFRGRCPHRFVFANFGAIALLPDARNAPSDCLLVSPWFLRTRLCGASGQAPCATTDSEFEKSNNRAGISIRNIPGYVQFLQRLVQ